MSTSSALIEQLPTELLQALLTYIPKRPLLRVLSLLSRRWRTISLRVWIVHHRTEHLIREDRQLDAMKVAAILTGKGIIAPEALSPISLNKLSVAVSTPGHCYCNLATLGMRLQHIEITHGSPREDSKRETPDCLSCVMRLVSNNISSLHSLGLAPMSLARRFEHVAEFIAALQLPSLTYLSVEGARFGGSVSIIDKSVKDSIATFISSHVTQLRHLRLYYFSLPNTDVQPNAWARLQHLEYRGEASQLLAVLRKTTSLRALDIALLYSELTGEFLQLAAPVTTVLWLPYAEDADDDTLAASIVSALQKFTSLRELHGCSDQGAYWPFAAQLVHLSPRPSRQNYHLLPHLQSLSLSEDNCLDTNLLPYVTALDISAHKLPSASVCVAYLHAALRRCPLLIDFSAKVPYSLEIVPLLDAFIREAIPKLQTLLISGHYTVALHETERREWFELGRKYCSWIDIEMHLMF